MSGPLDSKPPIENRKELRRRTLLSGLIFVPHENWTFDCVIRNVSENGAKIDLPPGSLIPNNFLLIDIKNCVGYEVEIVRRKERDVGLKLLRRISLTEDASGTEARELRRLLVERFHR